MFSRGIAAVILTADPFHFAAALWWACAIGCLLASTLASLCFPWPRRRNDEPATLLPVSAIVPIKDLETGFVAAQSSLFEQTYENLEVLVASSERDTPALDTVRGILAAHPHVPSRIVQSAVERAASPKLNNLWQPVGQAQSDVILTKDSNIVLSPGDVDCFVRHLRPGVGVVSAITITAEPHSLAAWVETSIVNAFHARYLMLARAVGLGVGCGKIMVFRRSDIDRAGGLECLAWALGEDAAMSDALAKQGLRTVLADRVIRQPLGRRSWTQIWNRQLRWHLIWRKQTPAVFAAALLGSALLAALAGAFAAPGFGLAPVSVAAATLGLWFCVETALCLSKSWPVSLWSPVAFLGREVLDIAVWIRALTTSEVGWAGAVCHAGTSLRENASRDRASPDAHRVKRSAAREGICGSAGVEPAAPHAGLEARGPGGCRP